MSGAPIKLTIYNSEHEPVKELNQAMVPWGIMKRAVKLAKTMKIRDGMTQEEVMSNLDDESIDTLTGLVADVFGGRVTVEEINTGASFDEMMSVLTQVMRKVGVVMGTAAPNPTKPSPPATLPKVEGS